VFQDGSKITFNNVRRSWEGKDLHWCLARWVQLQKSTHHFFQPSFPKKKKKGVFFPKKKKPPLSPSTRKKSQNEIIRGSCKRQGHCRKNKKRAYAAFPREKKMRKDFPSHFHILQSHGWCQYWPGITLSATKPKFSRKRKLWATKKATCTLVDPGSFLSHSSKEKPPLPPSFPVKEKKKKMADFLRFTQLMLTCPDKEKWTRNSPKILFCEKIRQRKNTLFLRKKKKKTSWISLGQAKKREEKKNTEMPFSPPPFFFTRESPFRLPKR